ncbi:MAG: 2Fe-2S iron-sulfur cluster-binding protein [Dehalococcoidia bacterium]|nr:2Fe-2S iron-sulfur cluster-binding protein [Dehalococcoidia bacterium]
MSEEKKVGLSRREFLKDAGLVVGGATVGSMAFLGACGCKEEVTVTSPGATKYICALDGAEFATETDFKAHTSKYHPFTENQDIRSFNVNGQTYVFAVKDTETLSTILRERLGLYGLKVACGVGECGTCTILMDDKAVFSCLVLAKDCGNSKITTVEGLAQAGDVGTAYAASLSNVQKRFYEQDAFQCGFCTPGFIMAGEGLLRANSNPSYEEARIAVSGHACLCGNIKKVVDALTGTGGVS